MNNHINYIEIQATDFAATKRFYAQAFGWTFQDWGDSYMSFHGAGVDGGFDKVEAMRGNSILVILHHEDLEHALDKVKAAGGVISQEIFSFPGGRRFQFIDPNGNELAVWTDETKS